jgi:hypothetical protein
MTLLTCAAVRRRLPAFHDNELSIADLISVESHLKDCPPCARDLRELQAVRDALRLAAAPGPADDWTGLAPGVISRMRAEEDASWAARARRAFDDFHLVWIGLASTAATFVCGAAVLGMLHFASPERHDSLAAVIAVISAPLGSDLNPARPNSSIPMRMPGVPSDDVIVRLALETRLLDEDYMMPLATVVTRDGRVSGLERVNKADYDSREVTQLIDALSRGRLEPAQFGGSPITVNLIWILANTTVRGKYAS